MEDLTASSTPWKHSYDKTVTPKYKIAFYNVFRRVLDFHTKRHLNPATLQLPALSTVLPERGFPLESRRSWVDNQLSLGGKRLLIQGTGTGWDVLSWIPFRPANIVAVDAFYFGASWHEIKKHLRSQKTTTVEFLVSSLENLPLASNSIDIVGSDAVFEHCQDLGAVMKETWRVLRPGGLVYASYGPMWFCAGGDHFSGRGGLSFAYSHVELPPADYKAYFETHTRNNESAQSGGRYVLIDLFSKLTTPQYLQCFRETGFQIVDLILEISQDAIEFRRKWSNRADSIIEKHGIEMDDLLIKANLVILRKPQTTTL